MSTIDTQAEFTLHGVKFVIVSEDTKSLLDDLKAVLGDPDLEGAAVAVAQQQLAAEAKRASEASTPPSTATAAGSPPPGSPGGVPVCPKGHGPMKDLSGQKNKKGDPYKFRYYCSDFNCREAQN